MAKPVKKPAAENLDEMLERIRKENEALKRLIRAIEMSPVKKGENIKNQ